MKSRQLGTELQAAPVGGFVLDFFFFSPPARDVSNVSMSVPSKGVLSASGIFLA